MFSCKASVITILGNVPISITVKAQKLQDHVVLLQSKEKYDVHIESQLQPVEGFGPYFKLIPASGQVKELQTIIRDR